MYTDTPTQGEINIAVDESYWPIIEAELYAFHSFYKDAKVHAHYKSEGEAVRALINDSVRFAIISRDLTDNEKGFFERINLHPSILKIASDAVAVVVHPDNKDTLLTVKQLKKILLGDNSGIRVVFDSKSSGNARFMQEKVLGGLPFANNCSALNSNRAVLDYVAKNKDAMGLIGFNWISDADDTLMQRFLGKIKVVALAANDGAKALQDFYRPFQSSIQQGTYPLSRDVYIVSREARAGLGTGFAAFIAGEKGQRIILKSGLLPATAPTRIININ
ncbi:MAG: PstS family phosphate ABC transporter substrate-binding protein [Flavobacteriales bacterium]